eukprot:1945927-Amphidinium_carterae.1
MDSNSAASHAPLKRTSELLQVGTFQPRGLLLGGPRVWALDALTSLMRNSSCTQAAICSKPPGIKQTLSRAMQIGLHQPGIFKRTYRVHEKIFVWQGLLLVEFNTGRAMCIWINLLEASCAC